MLSRTWYLSESRVVKDALDQSKNVPKEIQDELNSISMLCLLILDRLSAYQPAAAWKKCITYVCCVAIGLHDMKCDYFHILHCLTLM